jgi:hypothetical protein
MAKAGRKAIWTPRELAVLLADAMQVANEINKNRGDGYLRPGAFYKGRTHRSVVAELIKLPQYASYKPASLRVILHRARNTPGAFTTALMVMASLGDIRADDLLKTFHPDLYTMLTSNRDPESSK